MQHHDRLTDTAWLLVRLGSILNRIFLVVVAIALLLTFIFAGPFATFLAQSSPGVDVPAEMTGLRIEMVIGIATVIAIDRLLAALRAMLATTRAGDPFVAANARRLQAMGWALLAVQLLDVPSAVLTRLDPALGSAAPDGGISVGGWMATLLLFVLARIFAAGAVMRDDLEGTV